MATRTAAAGSTTWTSTAFSGGAATTAVDEVVVPTGATLTISAANTVLCRNISVTGTGTLVFAATTSIVTIGDATAGTGNVAISVAGTATITLTGIGTINLVSTSATQQTIDSGGKTLPNMNFNGAGSSYLLSAALTSSGIITWLQGIFNTGNFAMSASSYNMGNALTRTLTLGSSAITATGSANAWTFSNLTGLTTTANTAVITCTGVVASTNNIISISTWNSNGASFVITGGGVGSLSVLGATVNNLTVTGTANQTDSYRIGGSFTVTGTLTLNGNSAVNRPTFFALVAGTPITITAAATSISNFDFMDITAAGAGAWTTTSGVTGDKQGNSGITFTTPATQTRDGTVGNWSTAARWTSRVPLPQDNVVFNSSSANTTLDQLVMGKDITFTGYTGTLTLTSNAAAYSFYGSMTLASGMSYGANPNTFIITASGRSTHNITSNGKAWFPAGTNGTTNIQAPGGSYTLIDAFTYISPTASLFAVIAGSFDSSSFAMGVGRFQSSGTITRSVTLGTSTISLAATGAVALITLAATGLTLSASSATFIVTTASASSRSVDLGGMTIGTFTYTVAGSTGLLTFTSNATLNVINFSDATNARRLAITAGIILTILTTFNVFGASGRLITVSGVTAGTPSYISKPQGGILWNSNVDWLSVQDIRMVQPFSGWVGANSTNVSGNMNIYFSTPSGTFRHQQSGTINATATTLTEPFNTATTSGNLLVAYVTSSGSTGGITVMAGWTQAVTSAFSSMGFIFYKIANGTETGYTHTQVTSRPLFIEVVEYAGFSGTPTLDVTDSNGSAAAVTSLSTSAGTPPTNTAQPALAIAVVSSTANLGAQVSATNGFSYDYTLPVTAHMVVKEITTIATVETTITWTTSRTNTNIVLAVFKDVAVGGGFISTLLMMGV